MNLKEKIAEIDKQIIELQFQRVQFQNEIMIKEGDRVIIDFVTTFGQIFDSVCGILTKIWDEEPYCMVDDRNIDLVGEAHTTKVTKISNKKILVIGQALPAVKQELPYDTTQLYDWFDKVSITKAHAQHIFEFEAVYGEFPGYDEHGAHKKPTFEQMSDYYDKVLKDKIESSDKVIILGNVPKEFLDKMDIKNEYPNLKILSMIHPSKRNISLFRKNEVEIIFKLKSFLIWN